jgi:ABC-2 type transport system permease protein
MKGKVAEMGAILRHTFERLSGQVLTWGFSFAVLGWFTIFIYNTFVSASSQWLVLLKGFPPSMMVFFGDMAKIATPGGYLDTMLLSYGVIILGVFAVLGGSGLLAGDEEAGRLDLIQSYPISRTALFMGRFLALLVGSAVILGLTWAGCAIGLLGSNMGITPGRLALPFVSAFAMLTLFEALALWLSMVLPSRNLAASTAGILLVTSYFVTSLARMVDSLKMAARFSPLNYFQSGYAVDGLNLGWFIGLLIVATVFSLAAWWAYQRRDLRVSGEGNWGLARRSISKRGRATETEGTE